MHVQAIKTSIFNENQDLMAFLLEFLPKQLPEKSIVVVTSKIVALAEGRTVPFTDEAGKDAIIQAESDWALKTKYAWLTIKDGMVLASAGVDSSNANGKIILLPKDSFESADNIRTFLKEHYDIQELGVLISDSRLLPLRNGSVGIVVGYAGIQGFRDERGKKDLFGRPMRVTKIDVADSLATAAVLQMGEGIEQQPLALITGANVHFVDKVNRHELDIDIKEDLYRPLFEQAGNIEI